MNQMTFQKALSESADLLERLTGEGATDGNLAALASLLASIETGRGFFATYLTGSWALCDQHPQWFLGVLRSSSPVVSELLCRNLIMATATALVHERGGDLDNRAGSQRVAERTERLVRALSLPELAESLSGYAAAVRQRLANGEVSGEDSCAQFLQRREYDDEQLRLVDSRLTTLLESLG